jgi:hypothetical protein
MGMQLVLVHEFTGQASFQAVVTHFGLTEKEIDRFWETYSLERKIPLDEKRRAERLERMHREAAARGPANTDSHKRAAYSMSKWYAVEEAEWQRYLKKENSATMFSEWRPGLLGMIANSNSSPL